MPSTADPRRGLRRLPLALGVGLLAAAAVLFWGELHPAPSAARADGEIADQIAIGGRASYMVRYQTASGELARFSVPVSEAPGRKVGDHVTVFYDPSGGSEPKIAGGRHHLVLPISVGALGLVALAFGIALRLRNAKARA